MDTVLLGTLGVHIFWYLLPLAVAVSLVYAATRHEAMGPILKHAVGCGAWIVGLMVLATVVLFLISWWC
jgi:accessory gene regulator protein AgrB